MTRTSPPRARRASPTVAERRDLVASVDAVRRLLRALRLAARDTLVSTGVSSAQLFVLGTLANGRDGVDLGARRAHHDRPDVGDGGRESTVGRWARDQADLERGSPPGRRSDHSQGKGAPPKGSPASHHAAHRRAATIGAVGASPSGGRPRRAHAHDGDRRRAVRDAVRGLCRSSRCSLTRAATAALRSASNRRIVDLRSAALPLTAWTQPPHANGKRHDDGYAASRHAAAGDYRPAPAGRRTFLSL